MAWFMGDSFLNMVNELHKSEVGVFTSVNGEKTILDQLINDIKEFGSSVVNLREKSRKLSSLIIVSDEEFEPKEKIMAREILKESLLANIPILCINWGMYLFNSFFGGSDPVFIKDHHLHNGENSRHPVFISPGGKLSYTIGGSGWVTIPSEHKFGLSHKELSSELISTVYSEDRILHGIELPGKNWVVGVQWQAHKIDTNPKGFDNLLRYISEIPNI